jgi:hypothetical protein
MADRQLYTGSTNVPYEKVIRFKFFVDAGNQPTAWSNPYNFGISSIVWVSQGLYRITLMDAYKSHVETSAQLNVNAAGQQRFCQPGPVANVGTSTAATVDILVVDNAGAVQNPAAANANNFISGHITFMDVGTV